ncbi:diadenylate cyclase [Desulfovibrio inopinatus]|uniref:diadenylate cyclase n=1 Tax=Desulfovibrio inopinatus TaxID=102109 RepID=UPI00041A6DB5|nr:diadenylate cyclase [Desulfovibrio inopinatus]
MIPDTAKQISIYNVLEGLRKGLTHFAGSSRAALLIAEKDDGPIHVHDPQDLLSGHEPKLREIYINANEWRSKAPAAKTLKPFGSVVAADDIALAGLISYGAYSRSIFYQRWFTEHQPNLCDVGPTIRWLEHATWLLTHDFASEGAFFTAASKLALEGFEVHALRNHLQKNLTTILGRPPRLQLYPVLEAVLGISLTREEGDAPLGELIFVDPRLVEDCDWIIRFPKEEAPLLTNYKHVRKLLLAVEQSTRCLVSDGVRLLGIAAAVYAQASVKARFLGGVGLITVDGKPQCSFADGRFFASTRKPNLVLLEEALLDFEIDSEARQEIFRITAAIVESARNRGHGCSIIIDPMGLVSTVSGQRLATPLDLGHPGHLDLAKSLSKVDGSLHLGPGGSLLAFSCLLDGRAVPSEDRSRGARFNSALRFTAEHKNVVVVVVSEDRPVSIFQGGVQINGRCEWKPTQDIELNPKTLEEWLER